MRIDAIWMTPNMIFRCVAIKKLAEDFRSTEAWNAWRKSRKARSWWMKNRPRRRGPIIFYGHNTVSR